jgi:uncharacterized protein involved in exopolysaccharide biosynthesis
VVVTLLGAAIGLGAGLYTGGKVVARSTVLVSPLDGNPYSPQGSGDDLINLETEAQLVASDRVAAKVATAVGAADSTGLLGGLKVTVPANTQIVSIEYTAGSRAEAQTRAQAFATSYLAFRADRADSVVSAQAGRIQDEIDTLSAQIERLTVKRRAAGPGRRAVIQQQVNGATAQIVQLRTSLTDVQTGEVDPGQVITPAHIVSRDPGLTRTLFTGAGAVAGLVVAVLLVAVRSRARALRDPVDEPVDEPAPVPAAGSAAGSAGGSAYGPTGGSAGDPTTGSAGPVMVPGSTSVPVPGGRRSDA